VGGGTYYREYWPLSQRPGADPATVSGFRLDKYLVTVGRFRQFVAAWNNGTGWVPAAGSGKHTHLNGGQGLANTAGGYETGWVASDSTNITPTKTNLACDPNYATWTNTAGTQENLPMNCVNWYEAYAFCIWDGAFLPSEAEWEYAATGGSQQHAYPWGSTAPGTACPGTGCEYAIYNCDYPNGSGSCSGVANIAPVGTASLGAGLWGQLDLAGELYEWDLDSAPGYADPLCTNCANLPPAFSPVVLGGSFQDVNVRYYWDPPSRNLYNPSARLNYIGFRCARAP
jgi:formylglycine-generating enzyme required for sulfatase activity